MADARDEWLDVLWGELAAFRDDTGLTPYGWEMNGTPVMMAVPTHLAQAWQEGVPVDPGAALVIVDYTDALEAVRALRLLLGVEREAGET
jgi:hypothetical protein